VSIISVFINVPSAIYNTVTFRGSFNNCFFGLTVARYMFSGFYHGGQLKVIIVMQRFNVVTFTSSFIVFTEQ